MTTKAIKKVEHGILIEGLITIKQGNKVIAQGRNHWVDQGLRGLISQIILGDIYGANSNSGYDYAHIWYGGTYGSISSPSWRMYLGSDTTTVTTTTMTALVTPIGTAPGTPPNTRSASTKDGSTDGIWQVTLLATWNPGTVSGTVGELALYMQALNDATFGWRLGVSNPWYPAAAMISRLSSADVDFSSFVIDATKPLTVEWTVQFSFV